MKKILSSQQGLAGGNEQDFSEFLHRQWAWRGQDDRFYDGSAGGEKVALAALKVGGQVGGSSKIDHWCD